MKHRAGRARTGAPARIRIIGGAWRGRRLPVPPGVRPTPDRVRETLFNWLAPVLPGATVLDLFAGSGAMGLEALSRGAAHSIFVEQDPRAVAALRETVAALDAADRSEIHNRDAESYLAGTARPCDLVALDPPFRRPELVTACAKRLAAGWLAPDARVYVETATAESPVAVPESWELLRESHAGAVRARLYRVAAPAAGA